ncbi:MAG: hypothetical protein AAF004_03090 [Pseudomonadota bacterium]
MDISVSSLGQIMLAWFFVGLPVMLWLTRRWDYSSTSRTIYTFVSLLVPIVGWYILAAVILHGITRNTGKRSVEQPVGQHD